MRRAIVFLLFCAALAAAAAPEWAALRARYLSLKTLSGSFDETISDASGGPAQRFTGSFRIRLPGRYRLEVDSPQKQLIVCDSTTLWIYLPAEQRALRQPAVGPSPVLAFLDPVLDPNTEAEVYTDSSGRKSVRILTPDSLSALGDLTLELDASAERIAAFSFTDGWGNRTRFALKNQQWNPRLAARLFTFTPPKGTTIE
ncbi:MAG: outer membrane lipoprotein chaperone LolA [bacterium]